MSVDGGGWTLVGEVDGYQNMYETWLRDDINVANLRNQNIEISTFSCINAVELAVTRADQIRLSNSDLSFWVAWALPEGRSTDSWWNHSLGQTNIGAAGSSSVLVYSQNGNTMECQQNRYGILPYYQHGGSYPYTSAGSAGNTTGSDYCMAVGVLPVSSPSNYVNDGAGIVYGTYEHGFMQNGNGYDAPTSDYDWPNQTIYRTPHLKVWLR